MMKTKNKKVFIGMSGGVDSSVAAYLLKKQGYDVVGVFMHSFNLDGCEEKDAEDARRVAAHLNIPFYVMDFEDEYKKYVVEYMVHGYAAGLTPNPDVMCNKEIKFGFFLKKALELGADFVATGHYVRLASRYASTGTGYPFVPATKGILDSRRAQSLGAGHQASRGSETFRTKHDEKLRVFSLFEGKDKNKDQSYFLWTLTQEQLKHCLFPIGDYLKPEVRRIAKRAGLPTAAKKDSQGICFLGNITLQDFLKNYIPAKKGVVVNTSGEKIGEHMGAQFYTIGQRHGMNLRMKSADTKPHYVAGKDVKTNTIMAVEGDEHEALYRKEVELREVNLISKRLPKIIYARVRYRQPLAKAEIKKGNKHFVLRFAKPQKYVAPGQSAVFYSESGEMLGGGIII